MQVVQNQSQHQNQPPFRLGERIIIDSLLLAKIESGVAVLDKMKPGVWGSCGARHEVRVRAPFFVRGGFRVTQREICFVKANIISVSFGSPGAGFTGHGTLPPRSMILESCEGAVERIVREFEGEGYRVHKVEVLSQPARTTAYYRKFKHGEWLYVPDHGAYWRAASGEWRAETPWMVYEFISPEEAKLVDDVSRIDYVLLRVVHYVDSRSFAADVRIHGDGVVWHEIGRTACRVTSVAAAVAVVRYGTKITVFKNSPPYRGAEQTWIAEVWEMSFPPRVVQRYTVEEPRPLESELRPEDIV